MCQALVVVDLQSTTLKGSMNTELNSLIVQSELASREVAPPHTEAVLSEITLLAPKEHVSLPNTQGA